MPIVERLQAIYCAAKHLFITLLFFIITACADTTDDSQPSSQAPTIETNPATKPESALVTANDEITSLLLEDGFYQEQNPITDTNLAESKSLVENLEFSGAQEAQETEATPIAIEPFCLNSGSNEVNRRLIIEDACQKIADRLASVKYAACEAAKLQTTGCSSVKGFPILMREFPPTNQRKPQGKILIIGGTHGDELTSVSVTLRWIEKLNQHHSGLFHWHLVPMMNPDGVLKRNATRTNENGVDLNRNMPSDDWQLNAIKYWTEKSAKDPRKYPGESPSSEPESQWLIDEIESFKPDAIISVHAPYGVVDFDSLVLNTAPKSLGKLRLNLLGTYPGSLGNYAGINLNIPVITLELPHSWVMPSDKDTTKIWEDIVSWLKENINTDQAEN